MDTILEIPSPNWSTLFLSLMESRTKWQKEMCKPFSGGISKSQFEIVMQLHTFQYAMERIQWLSHNMIHFFLVHTMPHIFHQANTN